MPRPIERRVLSILLAASVCVASCRANAQTLSAYAEFQAMSVAQMQTLQAKLMSVGESRSELKTLVWRAVTQTPGLGIFSPFYRSQFVPGGYNSDYQPFLSFSATTSELKAMIDSVAAVAEVTDGGLDAGGYLSFALANVVNGDAKVFESVVNAATGKLLFGRLLGALANNDSAKTTLMGYACQLGMLPGGPPNDVTSQVNIQLRGFRKDRRTGQYVGRARITNTSQQTIAGPIIFVFRPQDNISPVGVAGITCAISPAGASYVTLPVGTSLGAGQQVDVTLRFDNPDGDRIELFSQRIFSGAGFR